jgi:hypothetical protein
MWLHCKASDVSVMSSFMVLIFYLPPKPRILTLVPAGVMQDSCKYKPHRDSITRGRHACNHSDECEVVTLNAVLGSGVVRVEVFNLSSILSTTPLNALLIHIIQIPELDLPINHPLLKEVEVAFDSCWIESLCSDRVEPHCTLVMKYRLVRCEELVDPPLPRPFSSQIIHSHSNCPSAFG